MRMLVEQGKLASHLSREMSRGWSCQISPRYTQSPSLNFGAQTNPLLSSNRTPYSVLPSRSQPPWGTRYPIGMTYRPTSSCLFSATRSVVVHGWPASMILRTGNLRSCISFRFREGVCLQSQRILRWRMQDTCNATEY